MRPVETTTYVIKKKIGPLFLWFPARAVSKFNIEVKSCRSVCVGGGGMSCKVVVGHGVGIAVGVVNFERMARGM